MLLSLSNREGVGRENKLFKNILYLFKCTPDIIHIIHYTLYVCVPADRLPWSHQRQQRRHPHQFDMPAVPISISIKRIRIGLAVGLGLKLLFNEAAYNKRARESENLTYKCVLCITLDGPLSKGVNREEKLDTCGASNVEASGRAR